MANDRIEFDADKGEEWDATIAAMQEVADTLPDDIRGRVSDQVEPWVTEAQGQVIAIPIKGVGKQKGLRAAVAAHVERSDSGDASHFEINVEADNPGTQPSEVIIPLGLDRPTGWRHPVFGNRNVWVQQVPLSHDWFTDIFNEDKANDVADAMSDAINDGLDRIAEAGG